jgi:hypothetical protein
MLGRCARMLKDWMVVQRPEDVLMLGGWVEQLEAVQTRPSALIWDPGALQRDSSPSKLGGDLVWSSSSQAASEVWGVHVCPSSSAISDCNRLVMDANVPNSVRSATDNCDACFL